MEENSHSGHQHHTKGNNTLLLCLLITLGFAVVEAMGGLWSGSLALLGDAGHMLTDATALGLAAFAAWVSKQPVSSRHSYGLVRAEVIAALINGLFMLLIVLGIAVQAVSRLQDPQKIDAGLVIIIAAIGLAANLVVAVLLHRGEKTLNTQAALLHVMGDLLGSVAALIAGMVIYFTGWLPIDPILSLVICALILYSSIYLLREVVNVLMEGVPPYLELPEVGKSMASIDGVVSVHDLHIWTLSSGLVALSAHVVVGEMQDWESVMHKLTELLRQQFDIEHVTLQPELMSGGVKTVHFQN